MRELGEATMVPGYLLTDPSKLQTETIENPLKLV
jgi:hypothetical protein